MATTAQHTQAETFYAVDSDLRAVWLEPLEQDAAQAMIDASEAHSLMSASAYQLVWTNRFDRDPRWYVFPREDRPALVIYDQPPGSETL